ncbi:hypothetical protein GGR57DRAFT_162921 [Xylariaceae sp. FL1272]|nr:hypothetical protein GGR57DRAFT_162921 [Xylariaceae sp. FL1272]
MCRNCDQEGHTSRECTEPKNMAKVQCRNCDEYGHDSRGCPKPRDYSRITCQNCGEKGHTKVRCKQPTVAPDDYVEDNGGFGAGDDEAPTPMPSSGNGWETNAATGVTSGGW